MPVTISGLYSYPVKSCAGLTHTQCAISQAGMESDRRWLLIDADGLLMTQRSYPRMALIRPRLSVQGVRLDAPGISTLVLSYGGQPHGPTPVPVPVPVNIFGSDTIGADEGDDAAQWLSHFLDTPCRLLRVHPQAGRAASPSHVNRWIDKNGEWAPDFPTQHVFGFADGFPFLLVNQASLDELNSQLHAKGEPRVAVNRFRPNIVLHGLDAYDEDHLAGVRIGAIKFAFVKPCARCPIPNIDQATARSSDEPGLTLAEHRRLAAGVLFGVNAVMAGMAGATIKLGDPVEPHYDF